MNTEWEECELVGARAQWFSEWVQIELSCRENDLKESMPEFFLHEFGRHVCGVHRSS